MPRAFAHMLAAEKAKQTAESKGLHSIARSGKSGVRAQYSLIFARLTECSNPPRLPPRHRFAVGPSAPGVFAAGSSAL
jgi:hypothetical protein